MNFMDDASKHARDFGTEKQGKPEKTVLIAGGAGFVGTHLCHRILSQNNRVICIDNFSTGRESNLTSFKEHPKFQLIEQDVIDPVQIYGPVDEIYNLACPASPPHYQADPVHTVKTSILGAINLLRLAKLKKARILQASTSEVYGDPQVHPQPENYQGNVNTVGPRSCYDEGKRCAETLFHDYAKRDRLIVKIARIFNTYGPMMRPDDGRVVSNFVCQALKGKDITIYGDGQQTRSFCFVDDLVSGLMKLMASPRHICTPVNLGNPGEFTVRELAELVIKLTGSSSRLSYDPLPKDDPLVRRPDIARANCLLGWAPKIPLRQGLVPTIRYFHQELTGQCTSASLLEAVR
jgi:UDP-glucuronate decarboxylase